MASKSKEKFAQEGLLNLNIWDMLRLYESVREETIQRQLVSEIPCTDDVVKMFK